MKNLIKSTLFIMATMMFYINYGSDKNGKTYDIFNAEPRPEPQHDDDSSSQDTKKYTIYNSEGNIVISTDNFKYYQEILENSKNLTGVYKNYNYNFKTNNDLKTIYEQEKNYFDSIDNLSNDEVDKHQVIVKYKACQEKLWKNNKIWMKCFGTTIALAVTAFIITSSIKSSITSKKAVPFFIVGNKMVKIGCLGLVEYYGSNIIHDTYRIIKYGLSERDETWVHRPGMDGHIFGLGREKDKKIIKQYSNFLDGTIKEDDMRDDLAKIINRYGNNKLIIQNILFLFSSYLVLKN